MKPGSMYIKFEYRIDSRIVKCFSLTGSISIKYHAPIRILPKVKYVFYFLFFFFLIEEKLTKDGHFYFSSIKTEWKSSVAQELLPVFPFFPSLSSPLFFFVLASWRQGFIILCKAMRRASVGFPFVYPRIISNARKQKNGNNRRTLLF